MVSGLVDPDTFIVQRSFKNNNLKIVERKLGTKDMCVQMTAEGENCRKFHTYLQKFFNFRINIAVDLKNSELDDKMRKQFCLNDENILKLCQVGIDLQENCNEGLPKDIEWAIHKVRVK